MICFVALIVFGVLGLFSATHREFAREAFDCVFRKMTLRKCNTGFDEKMKMKIVGKVMKRSPKASKLVFNHFELISWAFTILMIVSLAYSAFAVYNLAVYGTCDPQDPEHCVFTPTQTQPLPAQETCECTFPLVDCTPGDFELCGTDCSCLKSTCAPANE